MASQGNKTTPPIIHIFAGFNKPASFSQKIIGKNISSNHSHNYILTDKQKRELYKLLSIYRSKKEETFRYIFFDNHLNVVDHLAICSHSPVESKINLPIKSKLEDKDNHFFNLICDHLQRHNLMLAVAHNHPSGDITASDEDILITARLEFKLNKLGGINKFLGHIILDHGKFNFYTPQTDWINDETINIDHAFKRWKQYYFNSTSEDPLIKKNLYIGQDISVSNPEKLLALYDVAKKLDDKQNWNLKNYTPIFCLNNRTPVAIKFIDNEKIKKQLKQKNGIAFLKKDLDKISKQFKIKGFVPILLNDEMYNFFDILARKNLFIDMVVPDKGIPKAWSQTAFDTETHYPNYMALESSKVPTLDTSDNFKKSDLFEIVKKDFLFIER